MTTTPPVMVITGTSRGIGRGMAEHFSRKGWLVVGCSRGPGTLTDLPSYDHFQVDVSDEKQVREWVRAVKRKHGRIDALVCNVGLVKLGAMTGVTSTELFQSFVNSILVSTFLVCREFSKIMGLQRYGRIINLTSIMTQLHAPGTSAYSASKAAVVELTKVLAREVSGQGITCNVVSPSLVMTEASASFGEEWKKNMLAMQTLPRPIEVAELCNIVDFFASPQSGCVTGQVIHTCLVN